jgi:hypothetical protein
VDKLENDYRILKRETDKVFDEIKNKIDGKKSQLQEEVLNNTEVFKRIRDLLEKNKHFDITLEEKNNEINVI